MAGPPPLDASRTAWISRGFEMLEREVLATENDVHFDVLIVGSGYGGAVAAATFAGRTDGTGKAIRIGVLERGKEYLPGAFPTGLRELPRHVRRKAHKEGLFDIRLGPEVNTVIANGVGGGSLINAGVMEVPHADVFSTDWPAALTTFATQPYYARARELLGSRHGGIGNTISKHPTGLPKKHLAIKAIAPHPTQQSFREAEITVAMSDTTSSGNVELKQCTLCGDCATGCNFGAKNSLDVNLLVRAQQNGAEIYSGATVLELAKEAAGTWLVRCVHTNATLRARGEVDKGQVTEVRARQVVLAAGALGSAEILLRSKQAGLPVSDMLGRRCSTNGDMLIVDYHTNTDVHTVADERVKPSARAIGPTITGIIDLPKIGNRSRLTIEEMSVPAGLRLAFTEIFATINTLHSLDTGDGSWHGKEFPHDDLYAVSQQHVERSALYAVMADDGAAGTIELVDGNQLGIHDDGVARIRWQADKTTAPPRRALPDLDVFKKQVAALKDLTSTITDGRLLPNPVWKLMPDGMEWLLDNKHGPLTTVHPLGGCPMADSGTAGAVDDCGRVYSSSTSAAVHDGLVVLDGSMIPTALGTNPALTIAAVALRAAQELAQEWGYSVPPGNTTILTGATSIAAAGPAPALPRPMFRATDATDKAFVPQATEVEIVERLAGRVEFKDADGSRKTRVVELTLRFAPKPVAQLSQPPQDGGDPVLQVVSGPAPIGTASRIRIYDAALWDAMQRHWAPQLRFEEELDALALFIAPLTGSVRVFERQSSLVLGRVTRAIAAYWSNRGKRDFNQAKAKPDGGPGWGKRAMAGLRLASRSGEVRALTYDLEIGPPEKALLNLAGPSRRIEGHKHFTYGARANPWRQLMEVTLDSFPGLKRSADERTLKLDARHLVRIGVPLFRVVRQQDGVTALAELVGFFGYFLRLLLGLHIWSFRAPDEDQSGQVPNLLPRKHQPGLPPAQQYALPLPAEKPAGGGAAFTGEVMITRFPQPNPDPAKRPLLMLHGYSASGTTFAHHAVQDNFAAYFHQQGWDVWIAELRTSPAHELKPNQKKRSAEHHWSFEQIARADLPVVFNHIANATGQKIDVIAHCMGTVVFSMAVLDPNPSADNQVRNQVERVAFTQVGPLVVFSPANVFRGYALRYLIDFLPEEYSFRPTNPTLADDLWDRLLATLPYPEEEFEIENPPDGDARTPWTRTRHRMDALYGRDFNVANMGADVLDHIDDHFGALSLRTVAQTLHFVRYSMITTYRGDNDFVSRAHLRDRWPFPTFSVHGADNGLAHVATVDRMRLIFADARRVYLDPFVIPGAGHQDALVGSKRKSTCDAIKAFLEMPIAPQSGPADDDPMVAYPPWIGPILTEEPPDWNPTGPPALVVRLGAAPTHHAPDGVIMIRVAVDGDRVLRPDNPNLPWDLQYILAHGVYYKSQALTNTRWDAFFAPEPAVMPGFTPAHKGDGLLVLIVYADSPYLVPGREYAYFRQALMGGIPTAVEMLPLRDTVREALRPVTLDFRLFRNAAEALLAALIMQPTEESMRLPAHLRPGRPVLLAAADMPDLELQIPSIPNLPQPPKTTGLVFGTLTTSASAPLFDPVETPQGSALLAAIKGDGAPTEGVIPYDSPDPPLSAPTAAGTRFALLSCQYPAGFLDNPVAYAAYRRVLDRLENPTGSPPRFAVLTGDQVYVDPTAGLYDASTADSRYRLPYEFWLREPNVRHSLRRMPSFMLLDDHEIDDNWEPLPAVSGQYPLNKERENLGINAYRKYQRGRNGGLGFDFSYDGFPFYMLDTRTTRSPRTVATLATAELFDAAAFAAFQAWLENAPAGPKFVVSPAMLLPRHRQTLQHVQPGGGLDPASPHPRSLHSDGWDGYPRTLAAVLGLIAEKGIQHVVFLSGDEHRGCVATIDLQDQGGNFITRLHSIHTTAAYAPFPFANSLAEDFMTNESIDVVHASGTYRCVVNATPIQARDGATLLRPWQDATGVWRLDYEYADGGVQTLAL